MIAPLIFLCTVVSVYDGDTFTCDSGVKVRLAAIDTPELRGCRGRRGRICVPGDGRASQRALERSVLGRTLRCEKAGMSYRRVVAWCSAPEVGDLSCQMVRLGGAVYVEEYDRGRLMCRR